MRSDQQSGMPPAPSGKSAAILNDLRRRAPDCGVPEMRRLLLTARLSEGKPIQAQYHLMRVLEIADLSGSDIVLMLAGLILPTNRSSNVLYHDIQALKRLAREDVAPAYLILAVLYQAGYVFHQDSNRAFYCAECVAAARKSQYHDPGVIAAWNILAHCCRHGIGTARDLNRSFYWHKKSAAQGNAFAQYGTGRAYEMGEGVDQNPGKALKWYALAAAQDYAPAITALAWLDTPPAAASSAAPIAPSKGTIS